ncbi:putative transporter; Major facilitator superfamily MFS_1 [Cupriavidus taiwanensis]|uniref:Oxalate/formate MFS antiporter n=1 Tax=Cupriavidus taiwanensis TaxID=164546 RepID=A0A375FI03_9BURK|nr:oxalate/formate MFS antiporter [Cupriavidus taiwanensis]SOY93853.1 putative transporter; Major facilitator superfamily MFS_1 [Cupriavidus taiwanensis]SOY99599.1 putative transporter; Major facilitator superfamily MFS_1 [Cupriavidus taiwanensis]SPA30212.1 putative transporter; Major facilitator superfamily MFS_1 [Cupriavidus taiwanensis]SPA55922.1 putative transporter; Major facilitator superfamily MFS_1 [Cupriavidus taiwanensis]SPD67490.1 Oxalate/formate MFS antiporter [Cupriavidus taiwanen
MELQQRESTSRFASPWVQLVFGVICMAMIANMQYGWTLFVNPIDDKYGWGRTAIQVAFTIFVVTETWLVPIEGYLVDKYGPRPVVVGGGLLCAVAWALNSVASSLPMLYVAAAIGGLGAGAVYGTCVGNALKWFPNRRGLAAGITAAGFGAGSALTVVPIANMIKSSGYEAAFLWFGLGQGLVVFILGMALYPPSAKILSEVKTTLKTAATYNASPREVLKSPIFWVMYAMFVMMAAGGLMATAQLGPIAKDFGLHEAPISILGLTLPALTFALTIDRVLNGLTRPFFGWISDHIGRERTMFFAFAVEAVGILLLSKYGHHPVAFVILTGVVFFAWGEIYSLFPATCGDTFGPKFAATNAGLLYTAKGTAALLVPFSSVITAATGSWHAVFMVAAGMAALTAAMALFVLKPMREAHARKYVHANTAAPMGYRTVPEDLT